MYLAMRFSRRRKRIYPFLVFFAAASCVFLAFQFFSFNILMTRPQKPLPSGQATLLRRMTTEKCGSDGCHADRRGDVFKMESVIGHGTGGHGISKHYRLAKYTAKPGLLKPASIADAEHIDVKLDGQAFMAAHDRSQIPRGVPSERVNLYIPDSQNRFTCIHSKV